MFTLLPTLQMKDRNNDKVGLPMQAIFRCVTRVVPLSEPHLVYTGFN